MVGSEYEWRTYKSILTQKPGRLAWISSQILAIFALLAVYTVLALLVAAISSYAVAVIQNGPIDWPSLGETVRGCGAGWLILATSASLGAFIATLIRGSAMALGLGLFYLLFLENLLLGFASQSEVVASISKVLLIRNASDLVSSFDSLPEIDSAGSTPPGIEPIEPAQAALVLSVYALAFVLLAALLLSRRDLP